jgi:hypothetical protein
MSKKLNSSLAGGVMTYGNVVGFTLGAAVRFGAAALMCAALSTAANAEQPSGPISCLIWSGTQQTWPYTGFEFHPHLSNDPTNIPARITNIDSSCDTSGVTGGKTEITEVLFRLNGRLPHATCASVLSSAMTLERGKIRIQWRGLNPAGEPMTVAVTKAVVASASYDEGTGTLTITTDPIEHGAFAGQVVTLHVAFDGDLASYASLCDSGFVVLRYLVYGMEHPSTIEVQ